MAKPFTRSLSREEIDTDLYSRQIGVLGMSTMRQLLLTDVLIVGMTGVGVEVAKNVILAGVHSVTVHDNNPVQLRDLSSQFYLKEQDAGKRRSEACLQNLQELNRYVQVC